MAREANEAGDRVGVSKALDNIDGEAVVIEKTVAKIHEKLPDVEDQVPWWASLLKWGFVAAIVVAIGVVLWRINALPFFEKIGQKIADFVGWVIGAL